MHEMIASKHTAVTFRSWKCSAD